MKNFSRRETLNVIGEDLAAFCGFLAGAFLEKDPQTEGVQVSAVEIPYQGIESNTAFAPAGPERATARARPCPTPGEPTGVALGRCLPPVVGNDGSGTRPPAK